LSEPILEIKTNKNNNKETFVLDYFISKLKYLNLNSNFEIKLRIHPSEKKKKYQNWIYQNKNININFDNFKNIYDSFAWSNIVVGYSTYALYLAHYCNKEIYSSAPPNSSKILLPIKNLKYLYNLK